MRRSTVAVLAVVLLGNLTTGTVWHRLLPSYGLMPSFSSGTEAGRTENTVTPAIKPVKPLFAQTAVAALRAVFPIPKGWRVMETSPGVLASPLAVRCQPKDLVTPVVSEALGLGRTSGSGGGALVTVSAYSAGMGAAAINALRMATRSCKGTYEVSTTVVGTETFAVGDTGAAFGSGPSGRTWWMRVGDVVAMVSVRGADWGWVPNALQTWYTTRWGDLLPTSVCVQPDSSLTDVDRSPLSSHYVGWQHAAAVTLTAEEFAAADLAGQAQVRALMSPTPSPSPTKKKQKKVTTASPSPSLSPVVVPMAAIPMPAIDALPLTPKSLPLDLPEGPKKPDAAPAYPVQPTIGNASVHTPDPLGPGCGWAFTGQAVPKDLDAEAAHAANETSIAAAHATLLAARQAWWMDAYRYQEDITTYGAAVTAWNTWVASVLPTIAAQWWPWYDEQMMAYNTRLTAYTTERAAWQVAHDAWAAQCRIIKTPTPSPTPSPSPTGSPSSSTTATTTPSPSPSPSFSTSPTASPQPIVLDCPGEPVEPRVPVPPNTPTLPRPPVVEPTPTESPTPTPTASAP